MANKTEQVLEATENINNREAFFMKYKKAILIAVAAIIVVIAGVFLYISQISGPREEKASTALSKGQTYFNNEMFEQAVNGDGAGFVGFAKLADEYSGTKAGNWPTSMPVFATPTSANGQKLRRASTLSQQKATR